MILLVPISPELPKRLRPRLWPGVALALLLIIGFFATYPILRADIHFIEQISGEREDIESDAVSEAFEKKLQHRPLLSIAPAKGDWDVHRLLLSNFVHGSVSHLLLNTLCVFAGARICAAFLQLATVLCIFTLGGSIGLFLSMLLSAGQSLFIPHIGASAGIFSLMGAYYVYNFHFRTRYFFWFPTRNRYFLSLPTASFFFVDVLLVEIIFSTAQLLPDRWDNIDHFAHVFGFAAGASIAGFFRATQKWPAFVQTRAEYFLYRLIERRGGSSLEKPLSILELNSFNDPLKRLLIEKFIDKGLTPSTDQLAEFFRYVSPTFVRYHLKNTVDLITFVLDSRDLTIPKRWLVRLPYDLLVQIAYEMSVSIESKGKLLRLFRAFMVANKERPNVTRRVQELATHLETEIAGTPLSRATH